MLKEDPKNPDLFDGLGSALLMQGRSKEALASFDEAVDAAPTNPSYRINRGLCYIELRRFADAEGDFRVADASANPEDKLASAINRGQLRQMQGDFAGAEPQFDIALAHDAVLVHGLARKGSGEGSAGKESGSGRGLSRGRPPPAPERGGESASGAHARSS